MIVYSSNDTDILMDHCAKNIQSNPLAPFEEESFLVQSRGMASWVKLKLSQKLGIFSHSSFYFPEQTIWKILQGFLGFENRQNPYTKEGMAWKVFEILEDFLNTKPDAFAPILGYIGESKDENRMFRLSRQIATVFDSYLAYRPDMLIGWGRGRDPVGSHKWQAVLWRALRDSLDEKSFPELVLEMSNAGDPKCPELLPKRLSVFGVSTLPPLFLDILHAYGKVRPLHLYTLQPAPVMWGDVLSEKWKLRALSRIKHSENGTSGEAAVHIETGNPLIGSFGRTGRDFFNLLIDRDAHDVPLEFREPHGDLLLPRLQRWIFEVFDEGSKVIYNHTRQDESLVIKSCHSPMRETEVLRDFLIRKFAEDDTLSPNDVVVMMPDPEGYAPYIRAAFGDMENNMSCHFPFSIVDREPRQESQLVDFFFDLLEFFDGRATNREVLDLVDSLPIRQKFELIDEDIDTFRQWIRSCHAYWGLDANHRESLGSSPSDEHTWKHALDRMILGFCMRGQGDKLWSGVLPYEEIEGDNILRFSKLFQVLDGFRYHQMRSRSKMTLTEWKEFLDGVCRSFFPMVDENLLDRRRIRQAIEDLEDEYARFAPTARVPLRVIRYHLGNVVESGTPQGQFLTRGVTFCGLRPMRSVSARIICLLGMNDRSFPRQNRRPSFDLSGERKPGDRSTREDDRYLFLETLWCARDSLYLSYVGQSIRQAESIPPSVVINELLDSLDKIARFTKDGKTVTAQEALIERQSLHPFGSENYSGETLNRSFSTDHLEASRALLDSAKEISSFSSGSIHCLKAKGDEITLSEFIRFFDSPAKYFLVNTLGMSLWEEDAPPPDAEPLILENLDKYLLKQRLLSIELKQEPTVDLFALAQAEGILPPGNLGRVWFNQARREIGEFINRWGGHIQGNKQPPAAVDQSLGGFRFVGEIDSLVDDRQVLFRCGVTRPKDRLNSWIRHLLASAFANINDLQTCFYGLDKTKTYVYFDPISKETAEAHLLKLLDIFLSGSVRPLPFFPSSSLAYQEQLFKSAEPVNEEVMDFALSQARGEWMPPDFNKSGRNDGELPENLICFRISPVSLPEFAELADSIYQPLLTAEKKGKP